MDNKINRSNSFYWVVFALSLFFSLPFNGTAEAQNKDSLLFVLKSHLQNDTTKVQLLSDIASGYRDTNLDSMMLFANQGLQLAYKLNYLRGEASCLQFLGIGDLRRNKFDTALKYYLEALHIYEGTNSKKSQCRVLLSVADIYDRIGNRALAIECYDKCINICRTINNLKTEGLALVDVGGIYADQSNFPEAITYYINALKAFEKLKSNEDISMTMVNIATVYSGMGNYKKAKEYIDQGLAINGVSDKEVLFSNYVNSGVAYCQMQDYTDAFKAYNKAIAIADAIGDIRWKNLCLGNIADAYYKTGNDDSALAIYTRLLKEDDQADTIIIETGKQTIGAILVKRGKVQEGITLLQEALNMAQIKQLKQSIFETARDLSDAYERLHDYQHALLYHKLYYNYYDSLYNEKTNKRILQTQFDYELGKKESQITLLNKDKEIQQSKSERQKLIMLALVGGLVLLIIISVLLYRNSLHEKRSRKKILRQKEEIQKQAQKLEELNRFKDKTFSVLSHDLRGPLGSVTSTVQMLDQDILSPEEFSELKPEVNRQLKSLNTLLDNLLQWARHYIQGHTHANPAQVNLLLAARDTIELLNDIAETKGIGINNNIPDNIEVLCDPEQLQIIIRNIVMNAVKFTPNNGCITLNAIAVEDSVNLSISDTGVGMLPEQINKLFTSTAETTTYGTDGEKGIGLGLLLCYEFVKANNGSITVTSEKGKGTTFNVQLPLGA